jgi:hypothetical protein
MSKPLGPQSSLGQLLYPDLNPGEGASVLNTRHQGQIATPAITY